MLNAVPSLEGLTLLPGEPVPFGATVTNDGVNIAVFASRAENVELCIFDSSGTHELARLPMPGHSAGVWHALVPSPFGKAGLVYGFRVHGDYRPAEGLRHNPNKLLLDPYARAWAGQLQWHDALRGYEGDETTDAMNMLDSAPYVPKARVIDDQFDWGDDRPPAIPWRDTVIYELHVKGFTKLHPQVPPEHRGTYLGLADPKVTYYLKRLGITAVELLPVHAFISEEFLTKKNLCNYWGYNTLGFFAPASEYALVDPVIEFKMMVRALHDAGIEVILDVVFNHTAEGNELGPTLSMRGLDNQAYYSLINDNPRWYVNRSGCGNTVAVDHPVTRQLVIDCLRYWVEEMHVDGFRFDLAPVLGREADVFRADAAFFQALAMEPALRYTKLIAEPWDIGADGYHLGGFPRGWTEWNDLYRDTMRGYWRGNPGLLGSFAERFAGSSDLFRGSGRSPTASVNFISCHDGFTLADLVTYNDKHNEANLEDNGDGHNHNLSWNCGAEGGTDDIAIIKLRRQQQFNLLATLLCSQGVPMLCAGDEFGRTQRGNNNAYCQDNEINWVDWSLLEHNAELMKFVRRLLHLRKQAPGLRRDTFLKGARAPDREHKDVSWRHPSGRELEAGDWHDGNAQAIGVLIGHAFDDLHGDLQGHIMMLFNAGDTPVPFTLPSPQRSVEWRMAFDTAVDGMLIEPPVVKDVYSVAAHAVVLLTDGLHERRIVQRS
ncbi:MAG TPA: glycogen debranching protein GlgX [Steroidobacteraceae bacterium]|nr:glycogen debranching protein GlgX [Steroidobacteraceae bacterium]